MLILTLMGAWVKPQTRRGWANRRISLRPQPSKIMCGTQPLGPQPPAFHTCTWAHHSGERIDQIPCCSSFGLSGSSDRASLRRIHIPTSPPCPPVTVLWTRNDRRDRRCWNAPGIVPPRRRRQPGIEDHLPPAPRAPGEDCPPGLLDRTVKSVLRLERPNRDTVTQLAPWGPGHQPRRSPWKYILALTLAKPNTISSS